MIEVSYTKKFLKMFNILDHDLQDRVEEKVEQFRDKENHKALEVHKLKGKFKGPYAFSVDRKSRIAFEYGISRQEVILLAVGSHDIYR